MSGRPPRSVARSRASPPAVHRCNHRDRRRDDFPRPQPCPSARPVAVAASLVRLDGESPRAPARATGASYETIQCVLRNGLQSAPRSATSRWQIDTHAGRCHTLELADPAPMGVGAPSANISGSWEPSIIDGQVGRAAWPRR